MSKNKRVHIIRVKGGSAMTNVGGNTCCNTCVSPCNTCNTNKGTANFAFILVLFILLVICGAAFIF